MADEENAARNSILESIRRSLGRCGEAGAIALEYEAIPRAYKRAGMLTNGERMELFVRRVKEYDAGVYCSPLEEISQSVAKILGERGRRLIVIPEGLEAGWLPGGYEFVVGTHLDNYELDRLDGVLTGCTVAIAETGSIVLQNAEGQGPRALSLIPDYHLCVVFATQVVETVPEAFARLGTVSSLPTTFFSGPSATADIEMTRVKGVHGPRFLDILLVE